jgi:predicted N-acyltransferase
MLSFDDERWNHLTGGYKTPFDARPFLRRLENQQDTETAWQELWEELHDQVDVGDASYAAIPELLRV